MYCIVLNFILPLHRENKPYSNNPHKTTTLKQTTMLTMLLHYILTVCHSLM